MGNGDPEAHFAASHSTSFPSSASRMGGEAVDMAAVMGVLDFAKVSQKAEKMAAGTGGGKKGKGKGGGAVATNDQADDILSMLTESHRGGSIEDQIMK